MAGLTLGGAGAAATPTHKPYSQSQFLLQSPKIKIRALGFQPHPFLYKPLNFQGISQAMQFQNRNPLTIKKASFFYCASDDEEEETDYEEEEEETDYEEEEETDDEEEEETDEEQRPDVTTFTFIGLLLILSLIRLRVLEGSSPAAGAPDFHGEIASLRSELTNLRLEMRSEITDLRLEMRSEITNLRLEIARCRNLGFMDRDF